VESKKAATERLPFCDDGVATRINNAEISGAEVGFHKHPRSPVTFF
jgi:hypothetical protein